MATPHRLGSDTITGWRAAGRIGRSVLHGLHALGVVLVRFPRSTAAERQAAVGWWATGMLAAMGVELRCRGEVAGGAVLLVANHVSWLDILAVHAVCPRARFVSKADVRRWPLISRLATAADTIYLERERRRDALRVVHAVAEALRAGAAVAVFPEGTTAAVGALLPFHANLLQAAIATATPVQPIALRYSDARAEYSPAVEFVGSTTLLQSLWRVASAENLQVHVTLLRPRVAAEVERRQLAEALHDAIDAGLAMRS